MIYPLMSDTEFFEIAKTQFVHLLNMFESLSKRDYLIRFKEVYSVDGDKRLLVVYEAAERGNFTFVKRNQKGIVFTMADNVQDT